jgi:hypothetical protein
VPASPSGKGEACIGDSFNFDFGEVRYFYVFDFNFLIQTQRTLTNEVPVFSKQFFNVQIVPIRKQ